MNPLMTPNEQTAVEALKESIDWLWGEGRSSISEKERRFQGMALVKQAITLLEASPTVPVSRKFADVCEEAILGALPVVTDAIDDPYRAVKEKKHLRVVETKMRTVLACLNEEAPQ